MAGLEGTGEGVKGPQSTHGHVVLAGDFREGVAAADGVVGGSVAAGAGTCVPALHSKLIRYARHALQPLHDSQSPLGLRAGLHPSAQEQVSPYRSGRKVERPERSHAGKGALRTGRNACVRKALGDRAILARRGGGRCRYGCLL